MQELYLKAFDTIYHGLLITKLNNQTNQTEVSRKIY